MSSAEHFTQHAKCLSANSEDSVKPAHVIGLFCLHPVPHAHCEDEERRRCRAKVCDWEQNMGKLVLLFLFVCFKKTHPCVKK